MSFVPPKINTAFICYIGLVDTANRPYFKANPTIASGDFKYSIDGGAFANLGTLPTVTPAAGRAVKISLAAGEMNGDNIIVQCVDAAGAEWDDVIITLQTTARQIDDLAYPATSGRSILIDASGGVTLTSSQLYIQKNVQLVAFMFVMTNSTTHVPQTGLTVTATRSIDGAAFGACANAVAEVSSGWYKITLAAADLNGIVIALRFTATAADDTDITIVTQT